MKIAYLIKYIQNFSSFIHDFVSKPISEFVIQQHLVNSLVDRK